MIDHTSRQPSPLQETPGEGFLHGPIMFYTTEVIDRRTGDLREVCLGEFLTITELSKRSGVGPRQFRDTLEAMGLFQQSATSARRLLSPMAVEAGYGKTIWGTSKSGQKRPFDVISPLGQAYIVSLWDETVAELQVEHGNAEGIIAAAAALDAFAVGRFVPMELFEKIRWLLDHYPDITQEAVAKCLGCDPGYVSRIASLRRGEREKAREVIHCTITREPNVLMLYLAKLWRIDISRWPGVSTL